jgi:hypothetical protein
MVYLGRSCFGSVRGGGSRAFAKVEDFHQLVDRSDATRNDIICAAPTPSPETKLSQKLKLAVITPGKIANIKNNKNSDGKS